MNHGIRVTGSGSWQLTVNYQGDTWELDTAQVVAPITIDIPSSPPIQYPPAGSQGMIMSGICYRSTDGTQLQWAVSENGVNAAWIGFDTARETLDVTAMRVSGSGQLTIVSAYDTVTTDISDPHLLLALTAAGVPSLGRAPRPPAPIALSPEAVEALRAVHAQAG